MRINPTTMLYEELSESEQARLNAIAQDCLLTGTGKFPW